MKVGVIGEGDTEYYSVPCLVSKLGHVVVGVHNLGGVGADYPWEALFTKRVYPYVRGFAVKPVAGRPDKVIIVLDREGRPECCGSLATAGALYLQQNLASENLTIDVSIVLANREFECWLLANTTVLDHSKIIKQPISGLLGESVDEKNVMRLIKENLKKGESWDKPKYGKALAQKLDLKDAAVLARSRSLRKFVKEMTIAA